MARIGPKSSAQDVKDATGFSKAGEWRYFQNLTRDFLLHIFDDPEAGTTGDDEFAEQCQELAKELKDQDNELVATWDKVKPKESQKALEILNAQLVRQGMDEISDDVLRWRMLQAFRYEKKRSVQRQNQQASAHNEQARNPTFTLPPIDMPALLQLHISSGLLRSGNGTIYLSPCGIDGCDLGMKQGSEIGITSAFGYTEWLGQHVPVISALVQQCLQHAMLSKRYKITVFVHDHTLPSPLILLP
ncbi:hypothetical protein BST61_g2963 [Cercospora zeina]